MTNALVPMMPGSRVGHVVDPETGCWNWCGAKQPNGYGRCGIPGGGKRTTVAHRWYYERQHGPVSADLDLDHLCRNRGCVNPAHLEPVTRAVNAWRGRGCKLTPEIVREIRARYAAGGISQSQLARDFNTHSSTVNHIVHRRRAWVSA